MTSRFSFVATSALLASLLALASACSETIDVPQDQDGEGGDGEDSDGDGVPDDDDDGPLGGGDCPSNRVEQDICQPDVPVTSVDGDCDFGIQDGQCKPGAPQAGTLADCPAGITDGLCDPAAPVFSNWALPAGSTSIPGLHTAADATLSVEGATGFTAYRPSWSDGCAADTMPRFGSPSCVSLNVRPGACPADWPAEADIRTAAERPTGGQVYFVNPAAAGAGDGLTTATPATLAQALALATDGDIIALARGDYSIAQVILDTGVRVVGACAAQTQIIAASQSETTALVTLSASGARIIDLTLTGNRPGVRVTATGGTQVRNVQILSALSNGITVDTGGGTALTNVLINGTRTNGVGAAGTGISVLAGSEAQLDGVALVGNRGAALSVEGNNANLVGTRVVVTDTLAAASGNPGQGAVVGTGGNLDLTSAAIARNRDAGISVSGAGSTVFLTDAYITGTVPAAAGTLSGAALSAASGAVVTAQRLFAEDNALGLHVAGDSGLELTDVIVADPSAPGANPAANAGAGILGEGGPIIGAQRLVLLRNRGGLITQGGELRLENAVIAGSDGIGLSASGTDVGIGQTTLADNAGGLSLTGNSAVDVTDTRIVDTRKLGSAETHALLVDGSSGNFERIVLARNVEHGVFVSGASVDLDFTDLRVTDTRTVQEGNSAVRGIGLAVAAPEGAPALGVTRGIISQSHEYGVLINGPGPQVFLTDVRVTETQPASARSGGILFLNSAPATQAAGGLLELERVALDDNTDSGVSISGPGISFDLTDVSISNTRALASGEAAAGLSALGGAVGEGTRVMVSNSARAGVLVEGAGTSLTLTELVVSDTDPSSSVPSGEGLKVVGGVASITNAALLRNAAAGIWAVQGAKVDLTDVMLSDTQASPAGGAAVGIDVIGATLSGDRVTLTKNHGLGLSASLGAQVTIADLNIAQTSASAIGGRGVEVGSGSTVELNRTVITGSPDYAVLVSGPDAQTPQLLAKFPASASLPEKSTLNLYDLSVHDVGGGVAALAGSTVELDTFDIRTSGPVGLQLLSGATVKASSGKITGNEVGVNAQGSGIDLAKLLEDVVVSENRVDRSTDKLSVPSLSDVLSRSDGRLE